MGEGEQKLSGTHSLSVFKYNDLSGTKFTTGYWTAIQERKENVVQCQMHFSENRKILQKLESESVLCHWKSASAVAR